MERIWELFEKLDEMVYVSDVETYELVYMNQHLREALGYRTHEDYAGKRCYEVLQDRKAPCIFCTNGQLQPGEYVSWCHQNPVLKKRFLVKDSMIYNNGHRYRMEIAIDSDAEGMGKTSYYYVRSESILNECLQRSLSGANPEESIQNMLSYIGKTFGADRAFVFEMPESRYTSNTYEWCAPEVVPQKEMLQRVSLTAVDWWMERFEKNDVVIIPDLEAIRKEHPETYAILKPQDIHSLMAGPIQLDGKIIGFMGVDNPDTQMMNLLIQLLHVIGFFVSTLLKRRDLLFHLCELSYHDQLTGAYNRHALAEQQKNLPMDSAGVIYCDITGLKQVNDLHGHEAGDQLIRGCYELVRGAVGSEMIYRVGGDEFIAICPNCEREQFYNSVYNLQAVIRQDGYHIAVGYVWSDAQPLHLDELIVQADHIMYQDKQYHYQEKQGRRHREKQMMQCAWEEPVQGGNSLFQQFLSTSYCDIETLFQSSAQDNGSGYFYVGDMQKDLFYISDNMRDDFGFESNLVPGLLKLWGKRISTPEFQDLYWQDISGMLQEKRTLHDLRYRVRDVHGNNQWVRCYGILKWNEDKTIPLFFSGRVTHQDKNFVVDPISNFLREHAAVQHLSELQKSGEKTLVIGFCLNGITEINSTKGRTFGNHLLKKLADQLTDQLAWKMSFYRLEGMRSMAILNPICHMQSQEAVVEEIRTIIQKCFESMGVSRQHNCSFALIEYPCPGLKPEDLVQNLVSLLRVAKQEPELDYVDYSEQNIRRIRQMSDMVMALSRNVAYDMEHFRIVVQPVVSAHTGKAVGGEVLLRWSFAGQDVSPAAFIPVLEKENMIQAVGRWVFEQTVCTCVRLHAYHPDFYLTFNVSLHQLTDPQLLPFMRQTLEKYHLDGSSIVAELTESCLDEQPDRLTQFVNACRDMGIRIALDDFGSGYSSLRMLLQYPFDIIKLDKSLIGEVMESKEKLNFIRSIVYACHQFGKRVCMEGVERADQKEIILSTGCDMIQGYYYHRPMEVSHIYRLISQGGSLPAEGGT